MFVWLGRLPPPWQVARADKARHRVPPPADQRGARTAASLAPLAFLILLPWHRPGRSNNTDLATAFVLRCATRPRASLCCCSSLSFFADGQKKERVLQGAGGVGGRGGWLHSRHECLVASFSGLARVSCFLPPLGREKETGSAEGPCDAVCNATDAFTRMRTPACLHVR